MNIVILHCHFERGGVTQVVENQVRGLRGQAGVDRIVLVSGDRVRGLSQTTQDSVEHLVVDDFDYDTQPWTSTSHSQRSEQLFRRLSHELASAGIASANSLLHWHNHGLGKNTAAPAVIVRLAESGWRMLLQVHDFAEDNRPENYRRLISAIGANDKQAVDCYLYPVASQIHYCTLTQADAAVLVELGIPKGHVACLPNPVFAPTAGADAMPEHAGLDPITRVRRLFGLPADARWSLYPVRGIRRKNVGELLLLSQLSGHDQYFGLTLCPATPVEKRSYERWRLIAREVAPRVVFDAGQHRELSFVDNLLASDFVISTSVAEGFGMAFLEPWLLQREVIARRLPAVTNDFVASGMQFTKFYDSIPIPGEQAWVFRCRRHIAEASDQAWGNLPERFRPCCEMHWTDDDSVDFARLVPADQIDVLNRIAREPGFRQEVMRRSDVLIRNLQFHPDPQTLAHNAAVVREVYAQRPNTARLMSLYRTLLAAKLDRQVESPSHAGIALDLINRARPFYPCRTEEFAGGLS